MKRWLTLLAVVVLVGAGSYALTRLFWPAPPADEDQVTWIAREFKLTAAQKAVVENCTATTSRPAPTTAP
ncbi:hypothetical protein [Oleiharenicola sp. Vm1]|uniref:hypothetical protein n=1 Tax=Oleiharenicola sp. Vm1 TaxID=3398393 RepID=UPI0039F57E63